MKYATFSKSAFAVTAILVATACADSAEVPGDAEETPAPTTTVPPAAKPAPTTPPVEKKCAPSCKTDVDCQNSCPVLPGGIQCCDTKAGACFGSKTSTCPAPMPEPDGGPPPAY